MACDIAIVDMAANVANALNGLNDAKILSVTILDSARMHVPVTRLANVSDLIGKLVNPNRGAVGSAVVDTSAHVARILRP